MSILLSVFFFFLLLIFASKKIAYCQMCQYCASVHILSRRVGLGEAEGVVGLTHVSYVKAHL